MRAVLCKAYGPPESLVIEETPAPTPGPREVRIAVKAASVNFPDLLIIENKYQFKPPLPFSPGCEAAGVVSDVGADVVRFAVGDRVMAITGHGSFAEAICVPEDHVVATPARMDDVAAGSFLFTYATSRHALVDRAHLRAGETLLVLGAAGGIGAAAVEIGKALGARVIAGASSDDKLAFCRELGADETINYSTENLRDRIKQLVGDAGLDVVLDPVGGPYTEAALRSTGWRGRLLIVGFTAGDIPRIPVNLPLLKGSSIIGVSWGGHMRREPVEFAAGIEQLLEWYRDGKLKPRIDRVFPIERVADALNLMASRAVKGKVVVTL